MLRLRLILILNLILIQPAWAVQCIDLFKIQSTAVLIQQSAFYKQNTVNKIAEEIVSKIAHEEKTYNKYIDQQIHQKIDLMKETEQIIFFDHWDIKSIAESGFKNLHQTKKTKGWDEPGERAVIENNMLNIDLPLKSRSDSKSNMIRPKYGFLNILNQEIKFDKKMYSNLSSYGLLGAVLKNDVKKRSLWSIGDSFASEMFNNPSISRQEQFTQFGTFSRKSLPKEVKFNEAYVETQIIGDIDIHHVDHFIINELDVEDVLRNPEIKEYLKKLKIPVFAAERQHNNFDRFRYIKKERLF